MTRPNTLVDFVKKIQPENDCWLWTGNKRLGYARFKMRQHYFNAHRFAYELKYGNVPLGKELDHLCGNRHCVNPDHLEAVDHRTNVLRSPNTIAGINIRKTHCKRGHEFTAQNTMPAYVKRGVGRKCRMCYRERLWKN